MTQGILSRPSTRTWVLIHVIVPLLPFFIATLARFLSYPKLLWTTFNASELALSFGFIAVFVRQSLLDTVRMHFDEDGQGDRKDQSLLEAVVRLIDEDEQNDRLVRIATFYIVPISVFFALSVLTEAFETIVTDRGLVAMNDSLRWTQGLIYLLAFPMILLLINTQDKFRLKAFLS